VPIPFVRQTLTGPVATLLQTRNHSKGSPVAESQGGQNNVGHPLELLCPAGTFAPEVMAADHYDRRQFPLLTRLVTQIERVLDVNDLQILSIEVVEAARSSVIGQS
jgi:hypothetical protein